MAQEKLGAGDATDYLAISFSSNDYVVHLYGASSLRLKTT
ncbi:alkaline phosphatase [Vibrio maritimus]|uniref:Alkaline phosphatase n=1 Tax=Vibrio maritimus TaxID=990268 RepID=A0A090RRX7_9VIBR|nr:alkaline phosphatase [Vibrio maritimus]